MECSGGCDMAGEDVTARQCGVSVEAPPSSVNPASRDADDTHSQSAVSASDVNSQHSETAVSDVVGGTVYDPESQHVNIDDLSDEILVKIFSHMSFSELVDVIQRVSSRWRRLSQDLELWADKEYHIRFRREYESDTCKCGVTDDEAIQTFCDFPNLRKVSMSRCVESRVIRALYDRCRRLSELHLYALQELTVPELENLVEKCSEIHTLTVSNDMLQSEKHSKAVSGLRHLRVLNVVRRHSDSECMPTHFPHHEGSIPVLRPLGDGCPQLAEVNFEYTAVDTDDLNYFLTAKRNSLKSVHIMWATSVQWCAAPSLAVCAGYLERLELYYVGCSGGRDAFTALGTMKNLQELKMQIFSPPKPDGVAALTFETGGLPKLRVLDLQGSYCVTDDTVIAASRGCPALRELNVREGWKLTDAAFSEIYRLEHLEILDVSDCKRLGGGLIPYLATLPRLHTLVMEQLKFVELQPGLSSILEMSGLRRLTLYRSVVTGVPFDRFPGNLVNLRRKAHKRQDNITVVQQ